MRLIGAFLTLSVALAVLKAAATVVALAVIAAVILSAITRPMETAGCLLLFPLLGAIGQYPLAGFLIAGGLAALGMCRRT